MGSPELDLALICHEMGLDPKSLVQIFNKTNCRISLNDLVKADSRISRKRGLGILAVAESAGGAVEIPDSSASLEKRRWYIHLDRLTTLFRDAGMILAILPDIDQIMKTDNHYRIAATIPFKLFELERFFQSFEDTVLGLRRLIGDAKDTLIFLVPFMDFRGLEEISEALLAALDRNVEISFLTRNIGQGDRNLALLSGIQERSQKHCGRLLLFESISDDGSPISHAKVVSRDEGEEVYIGSANLNTVHLI